MLEKTDVKILSRRDTAKMLDVSLDTLDRLARRNEGPQRIRLSVRRLGYRLSDIHRWQELRKAG